MPLLRCCACGLELDASSFSKPQRKRKGTRRCKDCIHANKPESDLTSHVFDILYKAALDCGALTEAELDRLTDEIAAGAVTEAEVLEQWRSKWWWACGSFSDLISESDIISLTRAISISRSEEGTSRCDCPPEEAAPAQCRICFEECDASMLVAPCDCNGSARLVHAQCLVRWQQRGHLNACEVCGAKWKHGLDASTAKPSSDEDLGEIVAACLEAVRVDDTPTLRRRLSAHIVSMSGSELIAEAALLRRAGPMQALLDAGADAESARTSLIYESEYRAARWLSELTALPPSIPPLAPRGESVLNTVSACGGASATWNGPGANSRLLQRVLRGDAMMVRAFWAMGVDVNDAAHRFGAPQLSPLQLAIMRTPKTVTDHEEDNLQVVAQLAGQELGMLAVVDALIECGADLDYLSHHGSALMVALTLGEDCAALRLLYHGASTSLVHVDSGRTALIAATSPESRCSPALYAALVCFRLTGLTNHPDEFRGVERPHVAVEAALTPGHGEGLSGAELRAQGNAKMKRKDWVRATFDYSAALLRRGADLERAEPHKVLANRSLAHLHLAHFYATGIADKVHPVSDLMETIKANSIAAAIKHRKLPMSQSFRVLAYADASRAVKLAPTWAKAHARLAEAAYEIGIAAKRARDGHGATVMMGMSAGAFAHAHSLDNSKGYLERSCRVENEIESPEDEIGSPGDDELSPSAKLPLMLEFYSRCAGISAADLARAGYVPPEDPADDDAAAAAMVHLDAVVRSTPALNEKIYGGRGLGDEETRKRAKSAPRGAPGEWWAMSYSTVGRTDEGVRAWAVSLFDSTPAPHPYSRATLRAMIREQDAPPSLAFCKDLLLLAMAYPMAGPPRRPERVVIAWRMRSYYKPLREFAREELDVAVVLEEREVAVAIAAAHGRDIEGVNH